MAKVELQVGPWQERGLQVMVLLSFTMQLMLLLLAEFRRRVDSGVLRAVVWSAYMLADSTAIYALGHLSVTSRSGDHELMAFWAPFLLVHLGGQDNITAYAIEDNRLWLRHLQALAVQVAAAAYVLYESTIVGTQALLRNAAVLIFVVGVLKYGERVWALKRAGTSALGSKYQSYEDTTYSSIGSPVDERDREGLLRIAHLLLDVAKDLFQGPLNIVALPRRLAMGKRTNPVTMLQLYKVVEMQLSLMHDVVYTKAVVIHTWYGLCIRIISPVFTAIAFVLFHRSAGNHHYSGADGAVMLEIVSVLRAMFSRWPSVILGKLAYDSKGKERRMWGSLARAIASLRRFILAERDGPRWWWSGSMGQHNLIDMCVRSRASRRSRIAAWMGVDDWWNRMVYSSSVPVSTAIKELVLKQVVLGTEDDANYCYNYKSRKEEDDHIINSRGRASLKLCGMHERLGKFVNMELDESILVWHIATDIFLRRHNNQCQTSTAGAVWDLDLAKATEAISNYMLFLLAARPYMLPGSVSRARYVTTCFWLTGLKYSTAQDLDRVLTCKPSMYYETLKNNTKDIEREEGIQGNKTLKKAHRLAVQLLCPTSGAPGDKLKMVAGVWAEMLCYAGYRCSGYSHAKQLSNGGELLTIAVLLVEYRRSMCTNLGFERDEQSSPRSQNGGSAAVACPSLSLSVFEMPFSLS